MKQIFICYSPESLSISLIASSALKPPLVDACGGKKQNLKADIVVTN